MPKRNALNSAPKPKAAIFVWRLQGLVKLEIDQIVASDVGLKAYGLSLLPEVWSLPFVVVDAELAASGWAPSDSELLATLKEVGIDTTNGLIVRSSGTKETLHQRGRLESAHTTVDKFSTTLTSLLRTLPQDLHQPIHWIIQERLNSRRQGHLSNERRLSYEKRDWVLEKEASAAFGIAREPFGIRLWRDGQNLQIEELESTTDRAIKNSLRPVAIWATQFSGRYHFEWVWDGRKVAIVQMDEEPQTVGVDPRTLVSQTILRTPVPEDLLVFRPATQADFEGIRKLSNAALYGKLGYTMPPFYVLDHQDIIQSICSGEVPYQLRQDLTHLTVRPLIIRTDGIDLPPEKREMLPRSDELRSPEEAIRWLTQDFSSQVANSELEQYRLQLVAHHFIPSVASAWSRAEPASPIVRIEALWGIPEGLYYHAHDVYEIDVGSPEVSPQLKYDGRVFKKNVRRRFKRVFVAANEEGKWHFFNTSEGFTWLLTIKDDKSLAEIAWVTKQIAAEVGAPVAVMWFVDNNRGATEHRLLPWYHERCQLVDRPKAAPRSKSQFGSDYLLSNSVEWDELQRLCADGKRVERVRLEPVDPILIRDLKFAETLARLSKSNRFVVELEGGILSHVYYALVRGGARVECVDLFGGTEERSEYYKLVRDRVPELIKSRGEVAAVVQLKDEALGYVLRQKLVEESYEALDATSGDELVSELADVLEVLKAIATNSGASYEQVESARKKKARSRGGFSGGFMLTTTELPRTLSEKKLSEEGELHVCSDVLLIPAKPHYRKPDLRQIGEGDYEKVLAVETEMSGLQSELRESLEFQLPSREGVDNLTLSVSLKRRRATMRVDVRLRKSAVQLMLPFED